MGIGTPSSYDDEQPTKPAQPAESKEHAEIPPLKSAAGAFMTSSLNALHEETKWEGDFLGLPDHFADAAGIAHGDELEVTIDGKTPYRVAKVVRRTTTSPNGFKRTTMLNPELRIVLGVEKRKNHQPSTLGDPIHIKLVKIDGKKALWVQKGHAAEA